MGWNMHINQLTRTAAGSHFISSTAEKKKKKHTEQVVRNAAKQTGRDAETLTFGGENAEAQSGLKEDIPILQFDRAEQKR